MGEDVSFWLQLAKQSDLIAFSSEIECIFGDGIHIARNSNWGSPRFIWRTYQAMRWRKWCRTHVNLTMDEKRQNELQIGQLRKDFILGLLHDFRRFQGLSNPDIPKFFLCDPEVMLYLLPVGIKIALGKMRRQGQMRPG